MNPIYESLVARKSTRQFEEKDVQTEIKDALLNAAFQAPTAGNQMLYSIIDVTDQSLKDRLAQTCDHQPFIAKAPLVFIFLSDTIRWLDAYRAAGVEARAPGMGDLFLAIQDAVIAAQNMVVAAEAYGLGSCYIGDILENVEVHRELLQLDDYVVPISMLVIGYPTEGQLQRLKPKRFDGAYVVHENKYRRLTEDELREMHAKQSGKTDYNFNESITAFCNRKYMSDFSKEMTRSSEIYSNVFLRRPR